MKIITTLGLIIALLTGGASPATASGPGTITWNPDWAHRTAWIHQGFGLHTRTWQEGVRFIAIRVDGPYSHPCFDGGRKVQVRDINRNNRHYLMTGWAWSKAIGACDKG